MINIKIRFNTICDDNICFWRIIIDNKEYLCSNVFIEKGLSVKTTKDVVFDNIRKIYVEKHHISVDANEVVWSDNKHVTIR